MLISKFGHACLLVEESGVKVLVDPGGFSKGFENLTGVDALLITHQHQDHLVADNVKAVLDKNPGAKVYADEDSAKLLGDAGVKATAVHEGDEFDVGGVKMVVYGKEHIVIHPDIPGNPNVGYLVAGRLFVPGDAYTVPGVAVEILAVPAAGPWLKVEEAIDYLRAVKPKVAIPIHDGVLSPAGQGLMQMLLEKFGQAGELRVVPDGESTEV